jgi:hypothetical protein
MHDPIRDHLEDHLRGSAGKIPRDFQAHLEQCEDCAIELRLYELQSEMLRSLQASQEIEPRAGFYARVMDRIETEGRSSIWSVLLQPTIGRRMAVACATLVVLLGTYFVATELSEPIVAVAPAMASVAPVSAPPASIEAQAPRPAANLPVVTDDGQLERSRDAVLVNLASFHE